MYYEFPCVRRFWGLAFAGAVVLHGGIAAWAMQSSAPVVIPPQQVIRISMVAPSNPVQVEKRVEHKPEPLVPPKDNGLKQVEKKPEKRPEPHKEVVKKEQPQPPSQQTSGKQAADAVEKNSAITEPLFDASYLNNPVPEYPSVARRRNIQGKVLLDVEVTKEGTVKTIRVGRSSGHGILDKEALEKVRSWRFVPARRGSEVVEARVSVPVEFKLN